MIHPARVRELKLTPLPDFPFVAPGDDLARLVLEGLRRMGHALREGDVLVLAQKIVSKAEGRLVRLDMVVPSEAALSLARQCEKDPRLVEIILQESREVIRAKPGLLLVEHKLGHVTANAGVDQSNAPEGHVVLLPENPDASARAIREKLAAAAGVQVGVVISDSIGRAWRLGAIGHALGVSGVPALVDLRGAEDLSARALQATDVGLADQIAAAAGLVMGESGEGQPAILVSGLPAYPGAPEGVAPVFRPRAEDMFR